MQFQDIAHGYDSPSGWIDEPGIPAAQRELRQLVFDLARWRALGSVASTYPQRTRAFFEERLERARADGDTERVVKLEDELARLEPCLQSGHGGSTDKDDPNVMGLVQTITFRILQNVGKNRLPEAQWGIRKGKTDYSPKDVWHDKAIAESCAPELPLEKAERFEQVVSGTIWQGQAALAFDRDRFVRLLDLLEEAIWLTVFGGLTGSVQDGVIKALGESGDPEFRSFAWIRKQLAAGAARLEQGGVDAAALAAIGLTPKNKPRQLLSLANDIVAWWRSDDFTRLNLLRVQTWPAAALFRRTMLAPDEAVRALPGIDFESSIPGRERVRTLTVSEARRQVDELLPTLQSGLDALIEPGSVTPARTVRVIRSGVLRTAARGNQQTDRVVLLLWNPAPSRVRPGPESGGRVLAQTGHRLLRRLGRWFEHTARQPVVAGRSHLELVTPAGLRVTIVELPEIHAAGAMHLFATGPGPYVNAMQAHAATRGLWLTPFGLFRPTADERGLDSVTLWQGGTSAMQWADQAEAAIFHELGLRHDNVADRLAGAAPRTA